MVICDNRDNVLFANYFKELVSCEICHESRIFKIHLDGFDNNGHCLLTSGQRRMYSFMCCSCKRLNFLDFDKLDCEEYVKQLKINRKDFFTSKKAIERNTK